MTFNADNFKCRCSGINKMLSNSRSNPQLTEKQKEFLDDYESRDNLTPRQKEEMARLQVLRENSTKIILSDTCIAYLMEEYAWITEGMVRVTKEITDIPQMQKGTIVEPQSIQLLSEVDNVVYKPNKDDNGLRERIYNEFLSGEVDAYKGDNIMGAECIPDIKSSWDYPTFLCSINEGISNDNDWQVKGYLNIAKSQEGFIAKCLINAPEDIIFKLKWKLLNKMSVATEESPEFKAKWALIENSVIFDRIPKHKKVFKTPVQPMTAVQEQQVYDRVKVCREWLNSFHEKYEKLNK